MCVNALQSKYKIGRDWKKKEALKYAYPLKKAIEGLRSLISRGACCLIGDGSTIYFWKDPWIPWKDGFSSIPKNPSCVQENFKVADFIEASTKNWNRSGLAGIVDESSLEAILQVVIPFLPRPDKLIWSLDLSGNFSVKSLIKSTLSPRVFSQQEPNWQGLWKLKLHERLKIFIWRLGSNALPTKVNLAHHIGLGDLMCTLCGESEEPFSHLFLQCKVVRPLWFGSCWGIRSELIPASTNANFVKLVVKPPICQTSIRDAALVCA